MQIRILPVIIIAFFISSVIAGCSKLDTTDIGSDLLPAIDNVNTFEKILDITTTQGIFSNDSTTVGYDDDHVLGKINNDPLFGTTTANVYAQFKPTFYPYFYNIPKDSLVAFDSVVLCLSYKGFWGDSLVPLQLQVKEVALNAGGFWDSVNQAKKITYAPPTTNVLGNATVNITSLGKFMVYANHKDSVKNQIRIKLSSAFADSLFTRDSTNAFRSDSAFKAFQNGFAIVANGSGNGILYTNLLDSSSKLEIHYRKKNGATIDTTFSALRISTAASSFATSATANNIIRNRTGFPVANPLANELYLQTTPGTYVDLKVPQLDTFRNSIIHRAEIIIEQIPFDVTSDAYFSAPEYLYIDLKDTTSSLPKWKPIYFDLNPNVAYDPDFKSVFGNSFFPTGGIDFLYHGGFARTKTDVTTSGQIRYYNFNISRYVQQIVTKRTINYPLRLYAPYNLDYAQYKTVIPYTNRLAKGRVKVGSGTNPNYKMRLRLVYSKI